MTKKKQARKKKAGKQKEEKKEKPNNTIIVVNPKDIDNICIQMGCNTEEAEKVLAGIYRSSTLKHPDKEIGPPFELSEIQEVIKEMGCTIPEAIDVLMKFQFFPEYKSTIDYPEIMEIKGKFHCDNPNDALDIAITLKQTGISINQHPIIKSVVKQQGFHPVEAIEAISVRKQLSLDSNYHISYDKIAEVVKAIDCRPDDAAITLQLLRQHNYPVNYDEIKDMMKALGDGSQSQDAADVLIALKFYKEKHNLLPSFNLDKIPHAMKEINSKASEATSVLFNLQIMDWPEDIDFSFSDIKTMKELIGDESQLEGGNESKVKLAIDLAITKQKYTNGIITPKEWFDQLIEVSEPLESYKVVELMNMATKPKQGEDDLAADLYKMMVPQAQEVKPSATHTKNIKSHGELIQEESPFKIVGNGLRLYDSSKPKKKEKTQVNTPEERKAAEIKNFMEQIGCSKEDAVETLDLLKANNLSMNYNEIKDAKDTLGGSAAEAVWVLNSIKTFEAMGYSLELSLDEIPHAMEEIGCEAYEAANILLKIKVLNKYNNVSIHLSDVKKMKELIGDTYDLNNTVNLAVEKLKYKEGSITQEEWNHELNKVSPKLKSWQVQELMKKDEKKTNDDLKTDLGEMTVAQGVNPLSAAAKPKEQSSFGFGL